MPKENECGKIISKVDSLHQVHVQFLCANDSNHELYCEIGPVKWSGCSCKSASSKCRGTNRN